MRTAQIRQTLACLSCSLLIAATALAFNWLAPLMTRLVEPDSPLQITRSQASWLAANVEIGELVMVIPAGLMADRWGRRTLLLWSGPMLALGFILTSVTHSYPMMTAIRILQGCAVAIAYSVGPIYIAEIAEAKARGGLSSLFQVFWYAGTLYAYVTGPFTDYNMYCYLSLVLPILFMASFFYMPESPYFLLMQGRNEEAKDALGWLRGDANVEDEYKNISEGIKAEGELSSKGILRSLFATANDRRLFLIVQIVCITKYMNGMSAIAMYATQTFGEGSQGFLTPEQQAIALGVVLTLTTCSSTFLTDSFGRRPLLVFSSLGAAFFNIIQGTYYYLDLETNVNVSSYTWISYIALLGFCLLVNMGLAPLMQTIQAEFFSSQTRGLAGGITAMVMSISGYWSILQYQIVTDYIGMFANYWMFASISIAGAFTMYVFMPETAGQSLVEIQRVKSTTKYCTYI